MPFCGVASKCAICCDMCGVLLEPPVLAQLSSQQMEPVEKNKKAASFHTGRKSAAKSRRGPNFSRCSKITPPFLSMFTKALDVNVCGFTRPETLNPYLIMIAKGF